MSTTTRAKWGYLKYDDMLTKISEGVLNEYDIVYVPDRKENYIIAPDLTPWSVRSRVYVFNTVEEANTFLNNVTDTYVGQIVSVLHEDSYRGFIVNQDSNEKFFIKPLYENPTPIDYNTIGNRPIENLLGTIEKPIVVEHLETGIYKIVGQYRICEKSDAIYLSGSGDLVFVDVSSSKIHAKRITRDNVDDFVIEKGKATRKVYITDDYLVDYATNDYVDNKIVALEKSILEYVNEYISFILSESFDAFIEQKIDIKLSEMLQETNREEIEILF